MTEKKRCAVPSRGAQTEVRRLMLAKLETSCLTDLDAKALMMAPADGVDLRAEGLPEKMAFELPYFLADGRPSGFRRWRYLEDTRDGFAKHTDAKPIRYVQPKATLPEIYMPPIVDWEALQQDATATLVITEGELKAACCTKLALPCLGLGGVYSFKSVKKKLPLLPIFYDFEWVGRRIIVAFDSDAHSNPMVVAARNELCRELLALGALPHVADITADENGGKRGLDDLVLQDGVDELNRIFAEAEPFATSAALHDLNAEVAYVKDPGVVVVLLSGQRMRPADFTGHAYANRHYYEQQIDAKGNEKMLKRKAAPAWLEWPLRLELSRIAYEPGADRITEDAAFNTWPGWGCEPKRGSIEPWRQLLDHLFQGKPEERSWFERWCALPLQQPGKKMYTAAVLWGIATGTGKSLTGYTLGRIYGRNFTEIGDGELQDDRNEWAVGKQFVLGDDVTGHEQRKYADRLKKMITQREMRIDQKYVPSYTVRDVINYLFTSNHPDAFFLEDDDRRNFVHEVSCGPLPREFYRSYMEWLDGDGPAHLFDHLTRLDLKGMRAEDRAPDTSARRAMVEDGLSDLGRWVRRLRDDPSTVLRLGDAKLAGELWSAADLLRLYDPEGKGRATSGGLSRELKRAGLRQVYGGMPVRTATGQQRLFAIANSEQWIAASAKELAEHYDKSRGPVGKNKKF